MSVLIGFPPEDLPTLPVVTSASYGVTTNSPPGEGQNGLGHFSEYFSYPGHAILVMFGTGIQQRD
jgi:hypothetical protein